jgi:hypothetical protein
VLASQGGHFVGSRLELHDRDEPNGPLRVEHRVDAFHHLEDLREVAFDVGSRGVGLDDQTGLLEQFVRARWTSRRTETPAPSGIAWILAVAFMGLEPGIKNRGAKFWAAFQALTGLTADLEAADK